MDTIMSKLEDMTIKDSNDTFSKIKQFKNVARKTPEQLAEHDAVLVREVLPEVAAQRREELAALEEQMKQRRIEAAQRERNDFVDSYLSNASSAGYNEEIAEVILTW